MNNNLNIIDINESEFEDKVLKASSANLVLVDFWAPWCGPCKQLTPILEKITNSANGKVKLIKINIDENQQISSQLRIQSIPAVFAFKDAQPVDAFQGVIPEKKIIEFIEKSLGEKLSKDHSEFYKKITEYFNNKEFNNAKEALEEFLADNPEEYKSFAMYIDCLCHLENINDAEIFIESLNKDALENNFIKSAMQKLNIMKKNSKGPSIEELLQKINKDPKDINLILQLADKYFATNLFDEAFSLILLNFTKDQKKIKQKFLEFFEALGNENPKTAEYRKKLSSILFS